MFQLDLQKAYDMVDWSALEAVLTEIGLPGRFVHWIMTVVINVTYRFNVNGELTDRMQAKRGIRQGDPIPPLLFVIMMEYFNRLLEKMKVDPNFNHHAKCEKLGITNLAFADDVLLFCRGDIMSVDMMLKVIQNFSQTTGLVVNSSKCKVYFGGVDNDTKQKILSLSTFGEGSLPVRYLGVPLSSKKLNVSHYLPLIDKIMARVKHWTSKLLSIAGRIQLVRSTGAAIIQF